MYLKEDMDQNLLRQLFDVIESRKSSDPETSYVAKMFARGPEKIAQKVGEEAVELVIESIRLTEKPGSNKRREALLGEAADLIFHLLVMLSQHEIQPDEVLQILENRMGISGIEEKASRIQG